MSFYDSVSISLLTHYKIRFTYSMFMAEFKKETMLASFNYCTNFKVSLCYFLSYRLVGFLKPFLTREEMLATLAFNLNQTNGSLRRINADGIPIT